jgi:hypothetical protein
MAQGGIRTGVDKYVKLISGDKERGPDSSENADTDEKDVNRLNSVTGHAGRPPRVMRKKQDRALGDAA